MRIALIHSFYSSSQPSGENRVVIDQADALARAGHQVRIIARETDELMKSFGYHIRSAWTVGTGLGSSPVEDLRDFDPDVVHIHNLFPNFATEWAASWPGPIVVTLHNYRAICANGLLYRDGHHCTECPNSSPIRGIQHGCYRDSRTASIPVVLGLNRRGLRLLSQVERIVVTSPGSARILQEYLPEVHSFALVPNFGSGQPQEPLAKDERITWLAMGRFTPEKGFLELMSDWPCHLPLLVIGDGPLRSELLFAARGKKIEIRPSMQIDALRQILPNHRGLVFPSRWPEVDPQVVTEAMRVGLPVIAFNANVVSDLVNTTGAGATYGNAESLLEALDTVSVNLSRMSQQAKKAFEELWTEKAWLTSIEGVYESAISIRGSR